jgi:hypothetical protein
MKLNQIKTATISAASGAALDAAILAFVNTLTEEKMLELHFTVDAGNYAVLIVYT